MKQQEIKTKGKSLLSVDGLKFKDLNGNGKLDRYEDWRLPSEERADDLIKQMTLDEKVGMLMIDTLNSKWGGEVGEDALEYVQNQHMRRFIFRNGVNLSPKRVKQTVYQKYIGESISPREGANFLNGVQQLCEESRLGIPALFKSNARNHEEIDARFGININAGCFSAWPKEAGLAALRDEETLRHFARAMKTEWKAIGIRSMYGYMVDLATEPRWNRIHEVFTEDADLASRIITILIEELQGNAVTPDSIALTVKHFFGGGPQYKGMDPHYPFGKDQVYPSDNLWYHIKPFKAAIDAGVSSIMPYYGIPVKVHKKYRPAPDVVFDEEVGIGMGFNKGIVTTLLRDELGFKGNVNSDTGIITLRPWGVEDYSTEQLLAISVNAGIDVLSGFHEIDFIKKVIGKETVTSENNAYKVEGISEARVNEAVKRLLVELFDLGLFENPYVDADVCDEVFHETDRQKEALLAQSKSVVVLQNTGILQEQPGKAVYLVNMDPEVAEAHGYKAVDKPEDADFALVKILVRNIINPVYDDEGNQMHYPNGVEVDTQYGGPIPQESDWLSFSQMNGSKSWSMSPSYDVLQDILSKVKKENIIVFVNFRQPYVIDEECGLRDVGALSAIYGVSDEAIFKVVDGSVTPQGRLPYALPSSLKAVAENITDQPGYPEEGTLFPFGWKA